MSNTATQVVDGGLRVAPPVTVSAASIIGTWTGRVGVHRHYSVYGSTRVLLGLQTGVYLDRKKLKDTQGRPLTQGLFLEIGYSDYAVYAIDQDDDYI